MKKKILLIILALISLSAFSQQTNPKVTLTGTNSQATIYRGGLGANGTLWLPTHDENLFTDMPMKGRVRFTDKLQVHDGTNWVDVGGGVGGTSRFGIEDNTSMVDRNIDMNNQDLKITNVDTIEFGNSEEINEETLTGYLFAQDFGNINPTYAGYSAIYNPAFTQFGSAELLAAYFTIDGEEAGYYELEMSQIGAAEFVYFYQEGIIGGTDIDVDFTSVQVVTPENQPNIKFHLPSYSNTDSGFEAVYVDSNGSLVSVPSSSVTSLAPIGSNSYRILNSGHSGPIGTYAVDATITNSQDSTAGVTGNYSVGMGYAVKVNAPYSTVLGYQSNISASSEMSSIIGYNNTIGSHSAGGVIVGNSNTINGSATYATIVGAYSSVLNDGGVVIGNSSFSNGKGVAIGERSTSGGVAVGKNTRADNNFAIAIGQDAKTYTGIAIGGISENYGNSSIAIGLQSTIADNVYYSTAIGSNADVLTGGYESIVIGTNLTSDKEYGSAIGSGLTPSNVGEFVIGTNASTLSGDSESGNTTWAETNRAFRVGIGYAFGTPGGTEGANRDGLTIYRSGLAELPSVDIAEIDAGPGTSLITKDWFEANSDGAVAPTLDEVMDVGSNATVDTSIYLGTSQSMNFSANNGILINNTTSSASFDTQSGNANIFGGTMYGVAINGGTGIGYVSIAAQGGFSVNVTEGSGYSVAGTKGAFGGIKYATDYSAQFTDRSLVDKEYVDDAIVRSKPYKVYTALLTQTGMSAPVAVVLENTIGTITWVYNDKGSYDATSSKLFTADKTIVFMSHPNDGAKFYNSAVYSTSNIEIQTRLNSITVASGTPTDGIIGGVAIEIRVYN